MDLNKKYADPSKHTRWAITAALIAGGVLAGAVFGIVITPLGKIIAEAPPADFANYRWNAIAFAVMGGVAAPMISWSALRRVALWRTITEPLIGALVGAGAALLMGTAAGMFMMPLGGLIAVGRLAASQKHQMSERG